MRIVIVGAGRAGLEVATHLTRLGHAITIVDNDEMVTRRASEQHGLVTAGLISRHEHAARWAGFQRDIIEAERTLRRAGAAGHAGVPIAAVLNARKAAILDAARRGLITDRTAGRHVAALDEELVRHASLEHGAGQERDHA